MFSGLLNTPKEIRAALFQQLQNYKETEKGQKWLIAERMMSVCKNNPHIKVEEILDLSLQLIHAFELGACNSIS